MPSVGDLVLIDFPFTSLDQGKLRPVLVIADAFHSDWLFARVTSRSKSESTDVFLADWKSSGLRLPSWVQLSKLVTIEERKIERALGRVSERDFGAVRTALLAWVTANWPPPEFEPDTPPLPLDSPE